MTTIIIVSAFEKKNIINIIGIELIQIFLLNFMLLFYNSDMVKFPKNFTNSYTQTDNTKFIKNNQLFNNN